MPKALVVDDEARTEVTVEELARQVDELKRALAEQQAASREKQDWATTFDSVADLIALIDTSHTITRVNRAMAECCGSTREELVNRKCYEVIHGASAPAPDCPLARMLAQGEVQSTRVEEKRLGKVFDVTVSPVHDPDGGIRGCVHIARDVTGRVMTEAYDSTAQEILRVLSDAESERESIQRVVALVKAATGVDAVGIRLQDGDDYPFFYHEGFTRDFVHNENSLLMRTEGGGICRDDCGNVCLECTCGLVISGKGDPEILTSGGSFWTNDSLPFLHTSPDEERRTNPRNECIHKGFASVAIIPIRAKGRIVGVLQLNGYRKGCFTREEIETLENVARSIGEALLRKQAEEKLIGNERFLRTLTDKLPGVVGYWTADLRCGFANRAYFDWLPNIPEDLTGCTLLEVLGAELFAKNEPHIRAVLRGEPQCFERTFLQPCGRSAHGWVNYLPEVVDGAVKGFFVLVSDVTELKRAEEEKVKLEVQLQQAQKMESIGRLAGGVAHDFNNMLGVIIGRAELALQKTEEPGTYQGLKEIRDAAERSANLTRQLLAFARKQTIMPRVLDLNETISGMLRMLQRLIGEDIQLTWLPDPDLWRVHADPGQIDQILANLCVNARDAIKNTGRVTIRTQNSTLDARYCTQHPDAVPGEYVRLTVTDDGCGMDEETRRNIFEPFYTTKELGKGTGLGLATVFGIVKQHEGSISVCSMPELGTTFSLYFPRYREEAVQSPAAPAADTLPTGTETVLVVEDEPTILDMAGMMLHHQGYVVVKAGAPSRALEVGRDRAGEIDLLLTDVVMPEMNGKDLAAALQRMNPRLKCLFMSGYSADATGIAGVLEERGYFLQKPFTLVSLAQKIREVLDS